MSVEDDPNISFTDSISDYAMIAIPNYVASPTEC